MLQLGHKKLPVWQKSIDLVTEIYKLTNTFPQTELYGLTNQISRASISVTANIAEGASRSHSNDRKRFYKISRSSLVEIDAHFRISIELGFLKKEQLADLSMNINEVFALLSSMIRRT